MVITDPWNQAQREIDRKATCMTNIHVQLYKLDTLKNLKLHFKMLQIISLVVCIKKAF